MIEEDSSIMRSSIGVDVCVRVDRGLWANWVSVGTGKLNRKEI